MRIGILTFHWADNYGAVLQTYALSRYIKERITMDDSVEVINYENYDNSKIYRLFVFQDSSIKEIVKGVLRGIKNYPVWQKKRDGFELFRSRIPISRKYTREQLLNSENDYDIWITGSDQVWNTEIVGTDYKIYDLSFVKRKKKCSYAASSGPLEQNNAQQKKLVEDIRDLDNISVRESSTQEYLTDNVVKSVIRVVDPVFLLSKEDWKELIVPKRIHKKKYLFLYFISYDEQLIDIALKLANVLQIEIVTCCSIRKLRGKVKQFKSSSPLDFLNLIHNADFVVASSFHATAFSIIFERQFVSVIPSYASNRVTDLCKIAGLENRIILRTSELDLILNERIDYSKVKNIMRKDIGDSKKYLNNILKLIQ